MEEKIHLRREETRNSEEKKNKKKNMVTLTITHFTLMYVYFSVILLCNDRVRRSPIAMAQALAIHYAISLLALTLLLSDKIFLYELDLGGELV